MQDWTYYELKVFAEGESQDRKHTLERVSRVINAKEGKPPVGIEGLREFSRGTP